MIAHNYWFNPCLIPLWSITMRKTLIATTLLATAAATPAAFAHQAGDIIVRAGAIHLSTNESSSKIKVNPLSGNQKIPGTKATLNNDTQLGLNFAYMVTDHIGIELLAASPFELTAKQKGTLQGMGLDSKLGKFKALPPTLSAVYYPMNKASAFQPYVGLGVNRTLFFNEKANKSGGYSAMRVQNTWGWAAQVGADYMLTDNLMLNGQVRYIDMSTKARVDAANGAATAKVKLDVKPVVYMLGLGYKF